MKILFLAAANSIHTVRWVNSLTEFGHTVYLVYNRGHNPDIHSINKNVIQFELKYGGGFGYYLNARELKKIAAKIKPDIINAHYASGYGTLSRKAKLKNTILSVWGSDVYEFPYQSKIKNYIFKKNIRSACYVASTSICMADKIREVMNDPNMEIGITPFGVDLAKFNPDYYINKKEDIIVGNIKALKAVYGIDQLINAFHIMYKKLPIQLEGKVKLEIYGDGELRNKLQKQIDDLGEKDRILLMGKVPNEQVPSILSRFSIFCAISVQESVGVSLVEGMAMKVAVVATDVEGFKEVIDNSVTGWIVPSGDCTKLAEKMLELILDKEERKTFGENGRKRVEALYNWKNNVNIMIDIYKRVKQNT